MAPDDNPAPSETLRAPPDPRRERLVELLVFLFLIVPSMVLSFFGAEGMSYGFVLTAVGTILRDLALTSLLLFFLWRNGEPRQRIGWTRRGWPRELIIGLLLFSVVLYGAALLNLLLQRLGLSSPEELPRSLFPSGPAQLVLAFVLVVVVALAEETIFRGYLILRLVEVTRSTPAAVVLSAFIFALGHGYQGSAGAVTVGAMGLAFALVYVWRGSLVAPVVMHFLQDFTVLVLLPALGAGP